MQDFESLYYPLYISNLYSLSSKELLGLGGSTTSKIAGETISGVKDEPRDFTKNAKSNLLTLSMPALGIFSFHFEVYCAAGSEVLELGA